MEINKPLRYKITNNNAKRKLDNSIPKRNPVKYGQN